MAHDVGDTAISLENMLVAGNTKITDLLSVTPPATPQGAHAMTQLIALPAADAGLPPHRHSGPIFGYMLEGRMLFELQGEARREIAAGETFGSLAATMCTIGWATWTPRAGADSLQYASALPALT